MYIDRAYIITASKKLTLTGVDDMFTTGLSATGTLPITHYISTGLIATITNDLLFSNGVLPVDDGGVYLTGLDAISYMGLKMIGDTYEPEEIPPPDA